MLRRHQGPTQEKFSSILIAYLEMELYGWLPLALTHITLFERFGCKIIVYFPVSTRFSRVVEGLAKPYIRMAFWYLFSYNGILSHSYIFVIIYNRCSP